MENAEEVLQCLDEFSKVKPKDIPRELEDYLCFVAKTGDPVYQWSLIKCLFREKLINVITEFYESCPSVEIPPCPNVEAFNYDVMKNFILDKLESFVAAPFTVQRICELLTSPRKEYNRIDKYMRALEKNILVVSTREPGQRRSTENGESMLNGLETETQTNNLVSNEIHIEVEMEESPGWNGKADTNKSIFNEASPALDAMKPITEMTFATHDLALNSPLETESESAIVDSVIACSAAVDVPIPSESTDPVPPVDTEPTSNASPFIPNIDLPSEEPFTETPSETTNEKIPEIPSHSSISDFSETPIEPSSDSNETSTETKLDDETPSQPEPVAEPIEEPKPKEENQEDSKPQEDPINPDVKSPPRDFPQSDDKETPADSISTYEPSEAQIKDVDVEDQTNQLSTIASAGDAPVADLVDEVKSLDAPLEQNETEKELSNEKLNNWPTENAQTNDENSSPINNVSDIVNENSH